MTPEAKVKAQVKKVIEKYKSYIDSYWPVPGGYGESHLDCILCVCGKFVAIETKAPGKKPTDRQKHRIGNIHRAGGIALVIDGTDEYTTYIMLDVILAMIVKENT